MTAGATPQDWARFTALGLTADLLPVVSDTTIPISPRSRISDAGKTPSVVNGEGHITGLAKWTDKHSTEREVRAWSKDNRLGICLQTREVRAFDVDISDDTISAEVRGLIELVTGALPCRWRSNSGKLLLAFRMAGDFRKLRIETEHGPIEFLATGQQFIAAGTHTSGVRYEWENFDGEIPTLDPDEFAMIWHALAESWGKTGTVAPVPEAVEVPASAIEPVGLTRQQLTDILAKLDPDMPHDDWLHVGMGLHHETQGQGFAYWDDWSATGSKYPNTDTLRQRWDSFGRHNDTTVTIRTAMKLAGMSPNAPASPDEFETMVEEASAEPDKPPRFAFEPVHQFSSTTALPWIIKGVMPRAGLVVMYGASGSGKSFAALDMGMAVAQGIEWRGKRVKQGRVAYIAAEGADGFRKRLAAYAQAKAINLADVPMTVLNAAPNLLEKTDAKDIVVGIRASGGADVIVVDTFAQTTPGANENAGEDVGKALAHCKRIHELTGATVILIHHSGKDASKGARGWSGLRAAADAEIEVVREANGRLLRLSKSKDGEDGLEWGFDLEVVQLGVDEDMDPITSCVVVEAAIPAKGGVADRKLGKNEKVVNDVIQEFAQAQTEGIEVGPVLAEAVRRMKERESVTDDKKGNLKTMARRALHKLCDGDEAPYWLDSETNTIAIC